MLCRDDTRTRLVKLLTAPTLMSLQLPGSEIDDSTSLVNDLGLDSIQLLEFSIAIEEEFGLDITKSMDISLFDRFSSVVDFVTEARAAKVAATSKNV